MTPEGELLCEPIFIFFAGWGGGGRGEGVGTEIRGGSSQRNTHTCTPTTHILHMILSPFVGMIFPTMGKQDGGSNGYISNYMYTVITSRFCTLLSTCMYSVVGQRTLYMHVHVRTLYIQTVLKMLRVPS